MSPTAAARPGGAPTTAFSRNGLNGVNGTNGGGSGVLEGYRPGRYAHAYDEMFDADGRPRPAYRGIHKALAPIAATDLQRRAEALDRAFIDQGVTFSLSGQERPFPLDLVPRVITATEWNKLERGIRQRVTALELFLADVYGEQNILRDRVIPRRLVTSCRHFHRQAAGVAPPNGVRIHVAGIDLIRDEHGDFRVLEDNLRSPSGVSYVMENRSTMARVFPDLFFSHRVRAVSDYPSHLLRALRSAAAPNEADPTVVVLTPGIDNSAYFEHSLLARQMGVELVEGRDLFCRDNVVYMRTTAGEVQVDVVYRRVDDTYLDPMQFRHDSVLGVAGLLNAARAGNVVIANAFGNGVGDDKLTYTYVPTIIEYYLREKPVLPNVDTLRCWLSEEREEVLDRVGELVIKPVEGSGGYGIVIGPDASAKELDTIRRTIKADPRGWIAQPVVQLSTVPTKINNGLRPRHVDLRPFAVNDGDGIWVLPGGLTRVALPADSLVVNSSQGGGSKDTWVLAARTSDERRELAGSELVSEPPETEERELGRTLSPSRVNQQQQQQQQSGRTCRAPGRRSRRDS